MIKATLNDKAIVVDLLTEAFISNKSVLYIVKKDAKVKQRISKMMSYSFEWDPLESTCRHASLSIL